MALTNFSVNSVQIWAVVAGVELELHKVELRFALNSIADAVLHPAPGREVKSLIASTAHGLVDTLVTDVPVEVWCEAIEAANSGISGGAWPVGPFLLFVGKAVGTGWRKSRDGMASFVVNCRHFTAGMEFSWFINHVTHPFNVANFRNAAALELGNGPNFTIATLPTPLFSPANIETDLWGKALGIWFKLLCTQQQVYLNEAFIQNNSAAIAAINMCEPFNGGNEFGVPLAMNPFPILETVPGNMSIITDVANNTLRGFNGSTVWEQLVAQFGSRYLFALVPMADRALIQPVIPGLFPTWTTIDPDEYDSVSIQGFLPRPLRGLITMTGPNSMTGAFGWQVGEALDIQSIGGRFENTNMKEGMVFFRDLPQWTAGIVAPGPWAPFAAAPGALKGNFARPRLGAPPPFPTPLELRVMGKQLWDAFTRAMYLFEVFKYRRGSVTGKVRFDIAPGSSVELVTAEEKFIALQGFRPANQSLYGIVTAVTTVIDSEAVQGYTALEIGYLRNADENIDTNLTTLAHPLYQQPFIGAPLVAELGAEAPPDVG